MLRLLQKIPLHIQILLALVLAITAGRLSGETGSIGGVTFLEVYRFLGELFLRALRMLVVPLISSAIVTGVASLGAERAFGRLGLKTVSYYLGTSLAAILLGLFLVNTVQPGRTDGHPIEVGLQAKPSDVKARVGEKGVSDVVDVFKRMIPENVVATGADNREMLALIVFSILFGYFMSKLKGRPAEVLQGFWEGVYEIMLRMTHLVMKFAPLGVFGLVAAVAASTELRQFLELFPFFLTVLSGLALHFLVTLPLLIWLLGKVRPPRFYKAMFPALLTAFSTSSSSATIPITMECLQQNANVSRRVSSFVVPLGATVNMNGTALYECVAAMFIAQVYGLHITFGVQFVTVTLALLTSVGVAGVPSASLVAIVIILGAIQLPAEGIGLILVFERFLDMCRTAVNVFGDACGAVIIARSEGEKQILVRSGQNSRQPGQ